ncbi:hypothetical protein [Nonomuraea salmonea]|uniref:hypothetical protein n=1 Tax=Nonomuraea salmonea TaxID=46181 RepID=UPI0031ED4107
MLSNSAHATGLSCFHICPGLNVRQMLSGPLFQTNFAYSFSDAVPEQRFTA